MLFLTLLACEQECWTPEEKPKAYFTWSGIQRVDRGAQSRNGAMCLSSDIDKEEVLPSLMS